MFSGTAALVRRFGVSTRLLLLAIIEERGVHLHILDLKGEEITLDTWVGRFMVNILAVFAELERDMIANRTREPSRYGSTSDA